MGPGAVDPEPEKRDVKRGNTKRINMGKRLVTIDLKVAGGSSAALASRGLRLGVGPPN